MKIFYFDTHVHLDLYKDLDIIVKKINQYNSYTIAVTNLPILYDKALKDIPNTKYIRVALGLHPELIHKFPEQIDDFFQKLEGSRYIGEIGLDFSEKYLQYKDLQINFLRRCIRECDILGGKILSIHSRKATRAVIDIIGPNFNGKIIMHWFTGNKLDLKRAIDNGYYFSVNPEMLETIKGRNLINCIPLERILIESDGPFSKNLNTNYNIIFINGLIKEIAHIKSLENQTVIQALKNNFIEILN